MRNPSFPRHSDFRQVLGRVQQKRPRGTADDRSSGLGGDVLDRRLAIDAGQQQPWQQTGRACLDGRGVFPCDPCQVSRRHGPETGHETGLGAGDPQAFEQQVIEAEGQVEGRVAPPGALGVQENRAIRSLQDVLWADVAMHQCPLVRKRRRRPGGPTRRRGRDAPVRWRSDRAPAGCSNRVGRQIPPQRTGRRRCAMDACESRPLRRRNPLPQSRREVASSTVDGPQARDSPSRTSRPPRPRRGRAERHAAASPRQRACTPPRPRCVRPAPPQSGDLEPRQRALDTEAPPARLDKRDVRGHPAGQRREVGGLSGFEETHAAQWLDEIAGLNERRLAHVLGAPLRPQ